MSLYGLVAREVSSVSLLPVEITNRAPAQLPGCGLAVIIGFELTDVSTKVSNDVRLRFSSWSGRHS